MVLFTDKLRKLEQQKGREQKNNLETYCFLADNISA
jgi:hypothetical protein